MPIYEYKCDKCGVFEVTQRITERPLKKCPTCKSKVERIISSTSFVLKGSGWYATDYARTANSKADGKSDSGGDSSAGASSSTSEATNGSASPKGSADTAKSSEKSTAGAD
jgi:putative FmdB family regulatory protein